MFLKNSRWIVLNLISMLLKIFIKKMIIDIWHIKIFSNNILLSYAVMSIIKQLLIIIFFILQSLNLLSHRSQIDNNNFGTFTMHSEQWKQRYSFNLPLL